MKLVLGVFMLVHGLAHLPGFAVPWRLVQDAQLPYSTTILDGSVDLGPAGIRIYGATWLLTGLVFAGMGIALLFRTPWWYQASLWTALASILLCLTALPAASVGLAANLMFLAGTLALHRAAAGGYAVKWQERFEGRVRP